MLLFGLFLTFICNGYLYAANIFSLSVFSTDPSGFPDIQRVFHLYVV